MVKLGRKICCNYDKNVKCILLVNGHKRCIFDENTEKEQDKGELRVGTCALLPQSEVERFVAAMKKEGFTNFRRWTK